jgi:hypothetical protein
MNMMPLFLASYADANADLFTPQPSCTRPAPILNTSMHLDNVRRAFLSALVSNQITEKRNATRTAGADGGVLVRPGSNRPWKVLIV